MLLRKPASLSTLMIVMVIVTIQSRSPRRLRVPFKMTSIEKRKDNENIRKQKHGV